MFMVDLTIALLCVHMLKMTLEALTRLIKRWKAPARQIRATDTFQADARKTSQGRHAQYGRRLCHIIGSVSKTYVGGRDAISAMVISIQTVAYNLTMIQSQKNGSERPRSRGVSTNHSRYKRRIAVTPETSPTTSEKSINHLFYSSFY